VHIYRALDDYNGFEVNKPSRVALFTTYLERRVMNENTSRYPMLTCIRQIAERLCRENPTLEILSCTKSLCGLAVEGANFRWIFNEKETPSDETFSKHLISAAAYTNGLATAERCSRKEEFSWLFGMTKANAVAKGSHRMIELVLPHSFQSFRDERTEAFIDAATKSRRSLDTVRFLFNLRTEEEPWGFGAATTRHELGYRPLTKALNTSRPEVWEYIVKLREEYPPPQHPITWRKNPLTKHGPIDERMLTSALHRCAREGWTTMARYLIGIGACMHESESWGRPIIACCKHGYTTTVQVFLDYDTDPNHRLDTTGAIAAAASCGHTSTVRLLLTYGASPEGALAQAAHRGYLGIVELLLDHGASPDGVIELNEHKVKTGELIPLVAALELEHVRMFHLLLERGASFIDQEAGLKCAKVAKENGLDSMLDLLKENGVDVDADSSEIQLPLQKLRI
jgi:hypothetical protein